VAIEEDAVAAGVASDTATRGYTHAGGVDVPILVAPAPAAEGLAVELPVDKVIQDAFANLLGVHEVLEAAEAERTVEHKDLNAAVDAVVSAERNLAAN
jgi:hypothetical protein